MALTLTTDERAELQRRVRSLKIRSEDARRARVILMLADGESYSTIDTRSHREWRRRLRFLNASYLPQHARFAVVDLAPPINHRLSRFRHRSFRNCASN